MTARRSWRRRHWRKPTRPTLLFVLGAIGEGYELVRGGAEQPTLILVFAGMMGLPLYLGKDRDDPPPPPPPVPPPRRRPTPRGKVRRHD